MRIFVRRAAALLFCGSLFNTPGAMLLAQQPDWAPGDDYIASYEPARLPQVLQVSHYRSARQDVLLAPPQHGEPVVPPPVQPGPGQPGSIDPYYAQAPGELPPPEAASQGSCSVGDSCSSCGDAVDLPCACRTCDRWYVSFSGGTAHRETVHEVADARTFIEFDTGFAANVMLGYEFDVFRVEAEYSFMNNNCSQAGAGGLASDTVGNVNLRALMFNLYHDIQISDWLWKPYVGAGLGVYQSEINGLYPDFFNTLGAPFAGMPVNATSDIPLAYQFRVGASRPVGERTDFYTGYRYFHGETLTFSSAPFASFSPTFQPDGAEMHNVEFGLRVRF